MDQRTISPYEKSSSSNNTRWYAEDYACACEKTLYLDVIELTSTDVQSSKERVYTPVDIAVYGHYVALSDGSKEINQFIQRMPEWARGAEWTKFPSILISDRI